MANLIEFYDTVGMPEEYYPKPATKHLPEWYKNTEEYIGGVRRVNPETADTPHTVKKCIPVFDALTAGYILVTPCDVQITQVVQVTEEVPKEEAQLKKEKGETSPYYTWSNFGAIQFHPIIQAELHPAQNGFPYPKWINPFAIKTPPGYSVMFMPPMHNPNGIFTILPGIVDTDTYAAPVNFPFVLDNPKWEGVIPAGTPMAQVIPFKRDSWTMKAEIQQQEPSKVTTKLRAVFFNSYKRQFWTRKEFQ